jgi:hypothetical protein
MKGYGQFWMHDKRIIAHRYAYELAHGLIVAKDGEEVLVMHSCDNPPCCNPAHLSVGTDLDNIHDMLAKGRAGWQKKRAANGEDYSWPSSSADSATNDRGASNG